MAKHNKFTATADQLGDMYTAQGLSVEQMATALRCKADTIRWYLKKYGIAEFARGGQVVWSIDKETLRKLYHEEMRTLPEMAKILGCSGTTVFKKLVEYGLQIDAAEQSRRKTARNTLRRQGWTHKRLSGGYNYVKRIGHPLANLHGYVSEHRVVAEGAMGRALGAAERIHHINLNKRDNSIGNLAVLPSQAVHQALHKYMERCFVFLTGMTTVRPEPLVFAKPVFWGGQYVKQIDLLPGTPLDFLGHEDFTESSTPMRVN